MESLTNELILLGAGGALTLIGGLVTAVVNSRAEKSRREFELDRDNKLRLSKAKQKAFAEVVGSLTAYLQKLSALAVLVRTQEDFLVLNNMYAEVQGSIERAVFYTSDVKIRELIVEIWGQLVDVNATTGATWGDGGKVPEALLKLAHLQAELTRAMRKELGIELSEASAK